MVFQHNIRGVLPELSSPRTTPSMYNNTVPLAMHPMKYQSRNAEPLPHLGQVLRSNGMEPVISRELSPLWHNTPRSQGLKRSIGCITLPTIMRGNSSYSDTPMPIKTLWNDRDNMRSTPRPPPRSTPRPLPRQQRAPSAAINQWRVSDRMPMYSNDSSTSANKHPRRGLYKCGRCGGPKKAHHCKFNMDQNSSGAQTDLNHTGKRPSTLSCKFNFITTSKTIDRSACSATILAIAHEKNTRDCTEINQVIMSRRYKTCV